jgi:hypothetical protein
MKYSLQSDDEFSFLMFKILEVIYNAEKTRTLGPAALNINIPFSRASRVYVLDLWE